MESGEHGGRVLRRLEALRNPHAHARHLDPRLGAVAVRGRADGRKRHLSGGYVPKTWVYGQRSRKDIERVHRVIIELDKPDSRRTYALSRA